MKKSFFSRFLVTISTSLLLVTPIAASPSFADSIDEIVSVANEDFSVITAESSESSVNSTEITGAELAHLANNAYGNSGYSQAVRAAIVYEAAHIFCGPGFSLQYVSNGTYYLSKDRTKRVRVSTKASGIFQANFERYSKEGYNDKYRVANYHVNIK